MNLPTTMIGSLLLLSSLCLATPPAAAQETAAKGVDATKQQLWFGTLTVENVRQFRFLLQLRQQDGIWDGTLVSLDEGGREFPMSNIVHSDSRFSFELKMTGALYDGEPGEQGRTVAGKWSQRGRQLELEFRRVKERPKRGVKAAWKGAINMVVRRMEVAFVELDTGQLLFDSLGQKVGGFIAKDESTDQEVIFRVPAVGGVFKGAYSDDKSQIAGKWSQGIASFDLTLAKVDVDALVASKVSRPQTPQPPFPYESRDVSFPSTGEDISLAGTLTLPDGDVVAGVVLISGSGPQDRDESLLDHKPFLVVADHFSRHGIAVLRYDDRGFGKSQGDFATATSFDFADDAEGAFEYLQSLPELKGAPIGLCGHSEGGLIAPLVAVRNQAVDFVVLMAGTGVNGEQILYRQSKLIMEAEGMPAADFETDSKLQRIMLSTVVNHLEASNDQLRELALDAAKQVFSEQEAESEKLNKMIKEGMDQVSMPWFRTFLTFEPSESLTRLQCPALVINGERDLQVDPDQNLPAIRAALEKAGNKRFEIIEYPGLNHLFQQCDTGAVSEYQGIEETFNEQPLTKMTEWIRGLSE